jgi:protein-tyrosine phosphatase
MPSVNTGLIDTHTHLLPGIDDGCKSADESLACARALVLAGYTHAFCTPHVWPSLSGNTPVAIPAMVERLQMAYDRAGVALRLMPGGEMNLRPTFAETPADELVTYGMRGKYALVDMWADRLPAHFESSVRWMQGMGMTVILAHPERMRAVQDEPGLADYFAEIGLLLQGNLQCFNDPPTAGTRRTAERYLAEGRYWMLGSDTHGVGGLEQRLAGLRRVRELVDAAAFGRLTRENPARLI